LPGEHDESVFFSLWHELPNVGQGAAIDWDAIIALKADVARELETLRTAGAIGAPLEAKVDVYVDAAQRARLGSLADELRFVLITSEARLHDAAGRPATAVAAPSVAKEGVWIHVTPSGGKKCVRCWHLRDDVGSNAAHPDICGRCVSNVDGPGESRVYA
jgi:isoleucyl-tRNA synthetase